MIEFGLEESHFFKERLGQDGPREDSIEMLCLPLGTVQYTVTTLVYFGLLWFTLVHFGSLWFTLVHLSSP